MSELLLTRETLICAVNRADDIIWSTPLNNEVHFKRCVNDQLKNADTGFHFILYVCLVVRNLLT